MGELMLVWKCLLVSVGLGLMSAAAEMRIWTSVKGDTVEAEFKGITSGRVILKKSDGKQLKVPMKGLCSADLKYLETKIPPDIDIDVKVDKDKNKLSEESFYSYSYEKNEYAITCEVTVAKKGRDKNSMPLKAGVLVFSEGTKNKELKVIAKNDKEFDFKYSDSVTFNSDLVKIQEYEYSGYYSGGEGGEEYAGYVVYVENKDGEMLEVRGSSGKFEKNIARIKDFNKGTRFNDNFVVIK